MAHQKPLFRLSETLRQLLGDDSYNVINPGLHLLKGPAQKAIPVAVKNLQADLVVIGTVARTGVSGFLIGNTAEEILDHLSCSVLAVKPTDFVQYR
jgi:nucleotide-binding universal stress UspA family protein